MSSRAFIAALVVMAACRPPVLTLDGGTPPVKPKPPKDDGGTGVPPWMPRMDAGYVYLEKYAGEECPDEAFGDLYAQDGGPDDYSVIAGICVAMRELKGSALLNSRAATGMIEVNFVASQYGAEIKKPVGAQGAYNINVMRTRYDILEYHPDGIFPNHQGFVQLGVADMTKNQQKDLTVSSHLLKGGAFFGGLPFTSTLYPPDVYIRGAGVPPDQHAGATSSGGSYELSLIDGTMVLLLNSPPTALQGTELIDYPLHPSFQLKQDSQLDIDIPAAELEGNITIDGLPLADRKPGFDYELNYTASGENNVVAVTHHEGGLAGFHSMLPKGKYSITLNFDSVPDKHMPAMLFNKQVVQQVDLTGNATLTKNFNTVPIEGGITIDGKSPQVNPGYNWTLYMYSYASSTDPWFFSYYKVPLDSGSFQLKAFPGIYYVAIMLGDDLAPDLVDGYHRVTRQQEIRGPSSMPIVIETSLFTGHVYIDGVPPPVGQEAGTIVLRQSDQAFSRRIFAAQDGEFKLRVPKGQYDVTFQISRSTYPEYASGPHPLVSRLDLVEDAVADIFYETVKVKGPLRVGGKIVDDNLGGDDVQVRMRRRNDGTRWTWGFPGGTPNFFMRIPYGEYDMSFVILQDAIPDTAWGDAPLGYQLHVVNPNPTTGRN